MKMTSFFLSQSKGKKTTIREIVREKKRKFQIEIYENVTFALTALRAYFLISLSLRFVKTICNEIDNSCLTNRVSPCA